jgi:hypothetical protein
MMGVKLSGETKVILPSIYAGSPRYTSWKFNYATYMCTQLGCPSFSIMFTANPTWPEITDAVCDPSPTATSKERTDNVARVFTLKLDEFMHDLMHTQIFGRLAGISMVIE